MKARLTRKTWAGRELTVEGAGRRYRLEAAWAPFKERDALDLRVDGGAAAHELRLLQQVVDFQVGPHRAEIAYLHAIWGALTYFELRIDGQVVYRDGTPPRNRKLGAEHVVLVAVVPAALFVYLAYFFRHAHGPGLAPGAAAGIAAGFCLLYVVPTWIVLRNARLDGVPLYLFSLSVVPLYLALFLATMVYGIAWVRGLPSGALAGAAGFAAVVALFLGPPAACWLWYRLLRLLDQEPRRD